MKDNLPQNPKVMSNDVTEFCKQYIKEKLQVHPYQEQLLLDSKKWRKTILKHGRKQR